MGSSLENFCLRWNDFEANVSGAFRDLRAESDFFDVTLACEDNPDKTLQAHKVMLSACSSYFKQMLRSMTLISPNNPNPLIFLRGIRVCDLESVLDFIYHGEVNVAQNDLNSFLEVAEDLQIKGLTQQSSKQRQRQIRKRSNLNSSQNQPLKRSKPSIDHHEVDPEVKAEPVASSSTSEAVNDEFDESKVAVINPDETGEFEDTYEDSFGGYEEPGSGEIGGSVLVSGQENAKGKQAEAIALPCGAAICSLCKTRYTSLHGAKKHIQFMHEFGESYYECKICDKICTSAQVLRCHLNRVHKIFGVPNMAQVYGNKVDPGS